MKFPLVDIASPGTAFNNAEVFQEDGADAAAYERAVREYAQGTLREENLWRALAGLGFGVDEIEWHVDNPGKRMSRDFV
jgi:hypothetical protein